MIVVTNRIPVAKGFEETFEERFRQRAGLVDQADGFIRFEVLRPLQGDYYQIVTYWRDKDAFEAWTRSRSFQHGHAQARAEAEQQDAAAGRAPEQMFAGPNIIEIAEVVQESGRPLS